MFWSLVVTLGLGYGLGAFLRLWWIRVHSPRLTSAGAGWLALLAHNGMFGLTVALVALPGITFTAPSGPTIDFLQIAVLLGWALLAGVRRDPPAGLRMMAVALTPWLGLLLFLIFRHDTAFNPQWGPGGFHLETSGALTAIVGLLGSRLALAGGDAPNRLAPLPEADADGVIEYRLRARSSILSYVLAMLSTFLFFPAFVLYARPQSGTTPVTVRIWGEAVEIEAETRTRLSMAGGSVQRRYDLLGTPVIDLVGRDGTYTLPLGAVPSHLVDDLFARLQSATLSPEAAPVHPTPEALRKLQGRAVEGT